MRWSLLLVLSFASACPPRTCTPSNCDGCCADDEACVPGTSRSECGVHGESCVRCTTQERCSAAKCEAVGVIDAGQVVDAGPPRCGCITACCLPDGSCSPNNGVDACGPARQFCGTCAATQRCERGTCVAAPCGGCLDPLGTCRVGTGDTSCGNDGGLCIACGTDQACAAGQCIFTRCDMNNCRFGCCQPDKSCVNASAMACGLGGVACQACTGAEQCLGGSCQ